MTVINQIKYKREILKIICNKKTNYLIKYPYNYNIMGRIRLCRFFKIPTHLQVCCESIALSHKACLQSNI